jgi:hypothetical protein
MRARDVAIDGLVIGCDVRSVAMHVRMIVAAGRHRHVVLTAERAIRDECKRRHDRQRGREAPAHQLGETNHPGTGITLHQRAILVGRFLPVQFDDISHA